MQMALEADASDRNSSRLELLHQFNSAFALGLSLERVVVVGELGFGVGLVRGRGGLRDEVVADDLVPLRLAHAAVFVERLIDDIPSILPSLVSTDNGTDMVMHP